MTVLWLKGWTAWVCRNDLTNTKYLIEPERVVWWHCDCPNLCLWRQQKRDTHLALIYTTFVVFIRSWDVRCSNRCRHTETYAPHRQTDISNYWHSWYETVVPLPVSNQNKAKWQQSCLMCDPFLKYKLIFASSYALRVILMLVSATFYSTRLESENRLQM